MLYFVASCMVLLATWGFLRLQSDAKYHRQSVDYVTETSVAWEVAMPTDPQMLLEMEGAQGFQTDLANPGKSKQACYRIVLKNPHDQEDRLALVPHLPTVDRFVVFDPDNDKGGFRIDHQGRAYPQRLRPRMSLAPSSRVELAPNELRRIFVFVEDSMLPACDVLVLEAFEYERSESCELMTYASYFAITSGLFFFYLLFNTVMRDRRQSWFLGYLLSTIVLTFLSSGVHSLFFPLWGIMEDMIVLGALLTNCLFFLEFVRVFLFESTSKILCYRVLRINQVLILGSYVGVGMLLLNHPTVSAFVFSWVILLFLASHILALLCAMSCAIRRVPGARVLLASFAPMVIGIGVGVADDLGLFHDFTHGFPPLAGGALSMIFLGVAIAHQYRRLQNEHDSLQKNYTRNLEDAVEKRTRELSEAQHHLELVVKDRERVLSIVGHDLRNLIAQRESASSLLQTEYESLGEADLRSLLYIISESARTEMILLENLIEWGKSRSSGNGSTVQHTCSISESVSKALEQLSEVIIRKGLSIKTETDPELSAAADLHALTTVIRNLLTNAVKFTPRGGSITIRSALDGNTIVVEVIDSGIGMNAATIAALAGPSGHSPGKGTEGEHGSGLGLLLCRELLESFKGSLVFSSEQGQGTTATIRIPAA